MQYQVLIITMVFILLDIVFGVVKAGFLGELCSTKMREGLMHKCGFVGAVAVAVLCEYGMGYMDLGITIPIATMVCVYICLTELVSILENLGEMNPELTSNKFLRMFNIEEAEEE